MFFLADSSNYSVSELVFWACAFFGSTLFVVRLCMSVVGGLTDEIGHGGQVLPDDGDVHHSATGSFKLFTIHSLSGFLMMFGWVGLACLKQLHLSQNISCAAACFAGLIIMVITALIFHGAGLFVSDGTTFDIKKTIGCAGIVYQEIPRNGQGKIQIVVDGVMRELLAQSLDQCAIASFKNIRVVKTIDHETVVVKDICS